MNKKQILDLTRNANNALLTDLSLVEESSFFAAQGEKWSIAENVIHLTKSVVPLNKAFLFPKFVLNWQFGKPNRASRSYEELITRYQERVGSVTITAKAAFNPLIEAGATKASVLAAFEKQHTIYIRRFDAWAETDLDAIILPHPALGKITLREMGFFTAMHIGLHHTICKRYMTTLK